VRPPESLSQFRASQGEVVNREREDPIVLPVPLSLSPASSLPALDSWAPRKPGRTRRTLSFTVRDLTKSYALWVILLALSIDLLAVAVEPALLLASASHAPPLAAVAALLAALGLSTIFSMTAALPIAVVYGLARSIGRQRRPWNLAWPLPLVALAWFVVGDIAPHPVVSSSLLVAARLLLFASLATVMLLALAVARLRNGWARSALGALLGGAIFALSQYLPVTIHREPRDIFWLCLVVSAAAVLYPLRRALNAASHTRVSHVLGALCAFSMVGLLPGAVCPNWRVYARDHGRFAERLGRFCRTIIDFDGDGFSPVLGGMDCDDWNLARNPIVRELPDGVDRNCNGQTRPATPTIAQRGVAPPAGDPDLAPGAIDRVVLITLDCFRSDVFSPAVTPNLFRLAGRGVRFTRLYAGGARPTESIPLFLRGAYDAPPVSTLLAASGVGSTAIFAYRHGTLEGSAFDGFDVVKRPRKNDQRFRATEVTDLALADLRDPANLRHHFQWVHYFDAHGPRSMRVLPQGLPTFAPLPHEDPESALYLTELAYDDREIGRLLAGIDETGDRDRTVIVVSGDHGEGFGLHDEYEHGQSSFDDIIHVPGVLVAPGVVPGLYEHVASHRDIAATVLGAFGLVGANPTIEDFGRSWMRLRAAPSARLHDFVVTYSMSAHALQWQEAPMVVRTDDGAKLAVSYLEGLVRFYHLRSADGADGERRDVSPLFPAELARDRVQLEVFRDIDQSPR
jgi:hypothetical protein